MTNPHIRHSEDQLSALDHIIKQLKNIVKNSKIPAVTVNKCSEMLAVHLAQFQHHICLFASSFVHWLASVPSCHSANNTEQHHASNTGITLRRNWRSQFSCNTDLMAYNTISINLAVVMHRWWTHGQTWPSAAGRTPSPTLFNGIFTKSIYRE